MKKILAMTAAALTIGAGTVMAGDTANLNVSATVTASCIMTGGTLSFGSLNPTNPVVVNASSLGVSVTCTNDTVYTLKDNGGANDTGGQKRLYDGTNFIAYSITVPAGGTGTGSAETISIDGTIASTAYTTSPAGTYADTVTLEVTP